MKFEDVGGGLALKDPQEKFDVPVVKLAVDGFWIGKHTCWEADLILFAWRRLPSQHAYVTVGDAVSKAGLSHHWSSREVVVVVVSRVCFRFL
jgi:hypothetical protein